MKPTRECWKCKCRYELDIPVPEITRNAVLNRFGDEGDAPHLVFLCPVCGFEAVIQKNEPVYIF